MNGFYEQHRDENEVIHINRSGNHTYPSHFHQSVEIYIVRHGKYDFEINGKVIQATDGSVVFIDSYDIHSYKNLSEDISADDCVIIIPFSGLGEFRKIRQGRKLTSNIIYNKELCERLLLIVDEFLSGDSNEEIRRNAARLMLSLISPHLSFSTAPERSEASAMRDILSYIGEHYREEISRYSIAKALGYAPEHVSRIFNKYVKGGLRSYINVLRLKYINERLLDTDRSSLTTLIYEAGFNCEQTYYRAKKR